MIGRQNTELRGEVHDIWSYVPKNHLLRKIEAEIDFEFIYEKMSSYYSGIGRPSIDPVLMIKMLLIGYLYGINSERRLEEEVNLNIAYRYFCKLNLDTKAPDHSIFSQNRKRRFNDSNIFREIFTEIVRQMIEKKLVTGKNTVSDGSFKNREDVEITIEKSAVSYLDELDAELAATVGYKEAEAVSEEKVIMKNSTDTECGYSNQPGKSGFGYTTQMTVDTEYSIIIGVETYFLQTNERATVFCGICRV